MNYFSKIKPVTYTLAIALLPLLSHAQAVSDSLLTNFYNKTIIAYFSDTTTISAQSAFTQVLLKADIDTAKLVKSVGKNRFKYIDGRPSIHNFLPKPYSKNNGRTLYSINHRILGQDTIDVNIEGYTIQDADKKDVLLHKWIHGVSHYIPDGRFIYSKEDSHWMFISGEELSNEQ